MLGIVYLTKQCNFNCNYCFEKNQHKPEEISFDLLDKFIKYYEINELEKNSTICFFGGEPFLAFDKIMYVYNKCLELKKEKNKQFAFSTITNGSLVHKYISELKEIIVSNRDFSFELMISYDGSFQSRRNKSDIVEKNLDLLMKENIPFNISYTILKENMDPKIVLFDLINIIKKYFKNNKRNKNKIRLNFDQHDIESTGTDFDEYIIQLRTYLNYIYLKYNVSSCHLTCNLCNGCNLNERSLDIQNESKVVYAIPGQTDIKIIDGYEEKKFYHF